MLALMATPSFADDFQQMMQRLDQEDQQHKMQQQQQIQQEQIDQMRRDQQQQKQQQTELQKDDLQQRVKELEYDKWRLEQRMQELEHDLSQTKLMLYTLSDSVDTRFKNVELNEQIHFPPPSKLGMEKWRQKQCVENQSAKKPIKLPWKCVKVPKPENKAEDLSSYGTPMLPSMQPQPKPVGE